MIEALERFSHRFSKPITNRQEVERTIQWYEKEDAIENLVRQHRTPSFIIKDGANEELKIEIVIPPKGVDTSVDSYDLLKDGAWEFFSPDGKNKGLAHPEVIDTKVARELIIRRNSALQELSISTRFFARPRLH